MSEVVVLPKEVGQELDRAWSLLNQHSPYSGFKHLVLVNWNYLDHCYKGKCNFEILRDYCRDHPIEYMRALVEGYEIAKTPEEELLEYFKKASNVQHVIIRTLNTIGIKIVGINA